MRLSELRPTGPAKSSAPGLSNECDDTMKHRHRTRMRARVDPASMPPSGAPAGGTQSRS
jgi:hypothetical protein